jgi:RNA-directed DNA polymerase
VGAQDALVLKWGALRATAYLPTHALCLHVKGYGCRHSVRMVTAALREEKYHYVYRSDIRGYYQHMCKGRLSALVQRWVPDQTLSGLIRQFIDYRVEDGGEFHTPLTGISRGCALSPLLGASLLYHVDTYFASTQEVFYVRYMDDFLLLTQTRWALRRAIRRLYDYMQPQGFSMHPDKTQIGRVAKGFDWVGIWFGPDGLRIAPRALNNHRLHRLRLYEHARQRGLSYSSARERVQAYEERWKLWVISLHPALPPGATGGQTTPGGPNTEST